MERLLFALTGIFGALAVALGAFGAHGLKSRLALLEDGVRRLEWWQTAAHYHLAHALAIAVAAYLAGRVPGRAPSIAGLSFAAGILLFSGSLYAMTLTGITKLGAVTPFGGLLLIAGWIALTLAALSIR